MKIIPADLKTIFGFFGILHLIFILTVVNFYRINKNLSIVTDLQKTFNTLCEWFEGHNNNNKAILIVFFVLQNVWNTVRMNLCINM